MKVITTSWDDGHIADFRLAELLEKYHLKGTFYIPAFNEEHPVMHEADVAALALKFDIGGHTMSHKSIDRVSEDLFREEIKGCYTWLTQVLRRPPVSFCFPRGIYNKVAIEYTRACGFNIIRTTELLNPWFDKDNAVIPTTLQVYKHSEFTYIKHLIKRVNIKSLILYLKSGRTSDLQRNMEYYLAYIQENGGCFHLWGHSWEIEEFHLWKDIEQLFKTMSNLPGIDYTDNSGLVKYKTSLQNGL